MYVNVVYNNNVNVTYGPFTRAEANHFIAKKLKENNVVDAYIAEKK